jgi:prevent-host-death family protein
MGSQVNIGTAKAQFSRLIERAQAGEEITIARAGKPIARLSAIHEQPNRRVPGMDQGKVIVYPNFDDSLPAFDPDKPHPDDPMRELFG